MSRRCTSSNHQGRHVTPSTMSTGEENYFFFIFLPIDFFAIFLFMAMICCLVFPSSGTDKKLFYLLRVGCGETTIRMVWILFRSGCMLTSTSRSFENGKSALLRNYGKSPLLRKTLLGKSSLLKSLLRKPPLADIEKTDRSYGARDQHHAATDKKNHSLHLFPVARHKPNIFDHLHEKQDFLQSSVILCSFLSTCSPWSWTDHVVHSSTTYYFPQNYATESCNDEDEDLTAETSLKFPPTHWPKPPSPLLRHQSLPAAQRHSHLQHRDLLSAPLRELVLPPSFLPDPPR